jgi:hypothetical protein
MMNQKCAGGASANQYTRFHPHQCYTECQKQQSAEREAQKLAPEKGGRGAMVNNADPYFKRTERANYTAVVRLMFN